MQEVSRMISEYPLIVMGVCFVALVVLYFLFKSLIKLVLLTLIVAAAIGGYFYFQHPKDRPANLKEAVEKVRTGTGRVVEKGRALVDKGKAVAEKGGQVVDRGKEALEKGMDKGKAAVDKGKATVGGVLGGEKEAGKK